MLSKIVVAVMLVVSLGLAGCQSKSGASSHLGSVGLNKGKQVKSVIKKQKGSTKAAVRRRKLNGLIARYANAEGVPVALAHAVVQVESSYRVNARGAAGEIGLMQIRPATARMMGYRGSVKNLYNPAVNLRWGMKYLGKARRLARGNMCGTIMKYNAGHGAKRMNKISARYCGRVKRILRS